MSAISYRHHTIAMTDGRKTALSADSIEGLVFVVADVSIASSIVRQVNAGGLPFVVAHL